MKEVWKDVIGYEGLYQISNYGIIKSLHPCNYNNLLKCDITKKGYLRVVLHNNKVLKMFKVHRLVGMMFINNPNNKPQINHIDGVKANNIATNLEWVTQSENMGHAYKIGLRTPPMKGKFGKDHNNSKPIIQYTKDGICVNEYDSIVEASIKTGLYRGDISYACRGKSKYAGGYVWKFKEVDHL